MSTKPYASFTTSRIDRIGEALRLAKHCSDDLIGLDQYRRTFQGAYAHVIGMVRGTFRLSVTGRPSKSTNSIAEKLRRESTRLSQMQDIAGCRVVVDDIPTQDLYVDALRVFLSEPRIVDRRKESSNGYRAVHLMPVVDGHCVEIQVRTAPQHLWAEISEKLSDTVDSRLKYGSGDPTWLEILRNLSTAIENLEDEEASRADALRRVGPLSGTRRKILKKQVRDLERSYQRRRSELIANLAALNKLV